MQRKHKKKSLQDYFWFFVQHLLLEWVFKFRITIIKIIKLEKEFKKELNR